MKVNLVSSNERWVKCFICRKDTPLGYLIPINGRGEIADSSKTDDWIAKPVCKGCFEEEARLQSHPQSNSAEQE